MTNYNDGKWHGWNGGECPVHPQTMVDIICLSGSKNVHRIENQYAGPRYCTWDATTIPIIAFRVVKEYKEPREFWVNIYTNSFIRTIHETKEAAKKSADTGPVKETLHLREVI